MAETAPITLETAGSRVAAEVRRRVWTGALAGGERLNQEELARELGVSRIPVREALIALERDGVVRMIPHRGAFVEPIDHRAVLDHYELFGHLDGFALRKAIERVDDHERVALAETMRVAGADHDPLVMQRRMLRLRDDIHRLGGSPRFHAVARGLTGIVAGNFYEEIPGALDVAVEQLAWCAAAVESGDADAAVDAYGEMMCRHGELVATELAGRGIIS